MSYNYTHLEDFTRDLYFNINISSPNELNPFAIADALNIGLFPISTNSQAVHFEDKFYIFINNSLTLHERFEVFGHELGHVLLHTGNQQFMNTDYRMYQEWKANLFALHFCIPTFMLQQLPAQDLNRYIISETFGVTYEFACKRLNLYHQRLLNLQSQNYYKGVAENGCKKSSVVYTR